MYFFYFYATSKLENDSKKILKNKLFYRKVNYKMTTKNNFTFIKKSLKILKNKDFKIDFLIKYLLFFLDLFFSF